MYRKQVRKCAYECVCVCVCVRLQRKRIEWNCLNGTEVILLEKQQQQQQQYIVELLQLIYQMRTHLNTHTHKRSCT